jgi:DNA (cytosine-5)-methyltransferase 1
METGSNKKSESHHPTDQIPRIPIIDLFAGPGGLSEGFSACCDQDDGPRFHVALSIEKEEHAHRTLELRAFFRQFERGRVPSEYYSYLRGEISREDLFKAFPRESKSASSMAWHAELGHQYLDPGHVDRRIRAAVGGASRWVLIGGPPCQAYSTVGRSRMRGSNPGKFEKDPRHFLYREYLRVIAVHKPPVFVIENVAGILTCRLNGESIFRKILQDLQEPGKAFDKHPKIQRRIPKKLKYRIFPLTENIDVPFASKDVVPYIVQAENYGVPQTRHRVILIGVRSDIEAAPEPLCERKKHVSTWEVIGDLPALRSALSRGEDSTEAWVDAVKSISRSNWINDAKIGPELRAEILSACSNVNEAPLSGGQFMPHSKRPGWMESWYHDEQLKGVCNHSSRQHMRSDLHRYLFVVCFGKTFNRSPRLMDFPDELLPKHANASEAASPGRELFSDRFRVQLSDMPATTITSHMAKDGHYFIHPDPRQCRSLSVREAARLQTFPDNYFFEGSRTAQYQQVGNAVPPFLALQIAEVVYELIARLESRGFCYNGSRKKLPMTDSLSKKKRSMNMSQIRSVVYETIAQLENGGFLATDRGKSCL